MHLRDSGMVSTAERNDRTGLCTGQRATRVPIYADVWQGADGDEIRADFRVHESEKTGKETLGRPPCLLAFSLFFHTRPKPGLLLLVTCLCLQSESQQPYGCWDSDCRKTYSLDSLTHAGVRGRLGN